MLETCKCCNKFYNRMSDLHICYECDKKIFPKIKEYLEEHDEVTPGELSKALDLDSRIVLDYLNDERIIPITKGNRCTLCGAITSIGQRYCETCKKKAKTLNELRGVASVYKDEESPRMRYFDSAHRK